MNIRWSPQAGSLSDGQCMAKVADDGVLGGRRWNLGGSQALAPHTLVGAVDVDGTGPRWTENQGVGSSILPWATRLSRYRVAQACTRALLKKRQMRPGDIWKSSPAMSTTSTGPMTAVATSVHGPGSPSAMTRM